MRTHKSFHTRLKLSKVTTSGYALLEVLLGSFILVTGVVSLGIGLMQAQRSQKEAHLIHLANRATLSKVEEMRGANFSTLLINYSTGGTPGPDFDVPDLLARTDDPDGKVGKIEFVTNETIPHAQLGLPRDLNGNEDSVDTDISGNYRFLPTIITINYQGYNGNQEFKFYVLLAKR